jgi:hypothetical protein
MKVDRPSSVETAMSSPGVECYSGHTYAQEPRAFFFGNERRVVVSIRRRWREPAGPHFEVLADDKATYMLAYEEALDRWSVRIHAR